MAKKTKTNSKAAKTRLKIENMITSVMTGLQTAEPIETQETKVFRVSSMPYCSILHATNDLTRLEDYRSKFYTEIGTVMHTLIQDWMGRSLNGYRLFGNWKCRHCKAEKSMSLLPKQCKCAGKPKKDGKSLPTAEQQWEYVEIEVEYKGLTGHVDKVIRVSASGEEPEYVILDYKTTTLPEYDLAKLQKAEKKKKGKKLGSWTSATEQLPPNPALAEKYPVPYNVDQIEAYCALLTKVHKLNIVGWGLLYVDRSRPISAKSDYHPVVKVWTKKDQKKWIKRLDEACAIAPTAQKIFEKRQARKKLVTSECLKVIEARPCRTHEDFKQKMASAFHYEREGCKFMHQCLHCTDKDLADKLKASNGSRL